MCREDELPPPFLLPHDRYDPFTDKAVVEIILGLIDYKRSFRFQQQEQQDGRGFLAAGKRFQRLPRCGATLRGRIQFDLRRCG